MIFKQLNNNNKNNLNFYRYQHAMGVLLMIIIHPISILSIEHSNCTIDSLLSTYQLIVLCNY